MTTITTSNGYFLFLAASKEMGLHELMEKSNLPVGSSWDVIGFTKFITEEAASDVVDKFSHQSIYGEGYTDYMSEDSFYANACESLRSLLLSNDLTADNYAILKAITEVKMEPTEPIEGNLHDTTREKCTLTDEQLTEKCSDWVSKLCESGGNAWVLSIPVRMDKDPDMLFTELINRFKGLTSKIDHQ